MLLQMEDIDSAGAFDRLSAEAMMTGTFYPVILADVRLPTEEQGLQLLDDIKRVSPRSRVISLTGFSTPELDRQVREHGSTKVIRKPASSSEIIAAVTALVAEMERLADAAAALTAKFETRLANLKNQYLGNLPARVASISAALRQRQEGIEQIDGDLHRQFHNMAGTAGTYGLFTIAAAATDGMDECANLGMAPIEGAARYLWSLIEELENAVRVESIGQTINSPLGAQSQAREL